MHRLIMGVTDRRVWTDHINHDGLDNRRANLRVCTNRQNQRNQRAQGVPKTSRYKGVWFSTREHCWTAQIAVGDNRIHLGYFTSEESAAVAYDNAARKYFGEFAQTNFTPAAAPSIGIELAFSS